MDESPFPPISLPVKILDKYQKKITTIPEDYITVNIINWGVLNIKTLTVTCDKKFENTTVINAAEFYSLQSYFIELDKGNYIFFKFFIKEI